MLAACGANPGGNTADPAAQEQPAPKAADVSMIDGTAKMLSIAKQLREAASAGDEAKIKELAPTLDEVWTSFNEGVRAKYPNISEQIGKNLSPVVSITKTETFDKEQVIIADNQLINALYILSVELIPVDQVKAGAYQMLEITSELGKEITAGNDAKVKELAPKLEDIWKTIGDGVPPRRADLYEQIEKSLHPEVAGSQKSPIDKQVMTQLNDDLSHALHELTQGI